MVSREMVSAQYVGGGEKVPFEDARILQEQWGQAGTCFSGRSQVPEPLHPFSVWGVPSLVMVGAGPSRSFQWEIHP